MKISVNINPLLNKNKSGIGYYQTELLKAFMESGTDADFCMQYFDARNHGKTSPPDWLSACRRECCKAFPLAIYQLICGILPFPYKWLFHEKSDITMFFNFFLPPFVSGKGILVVYDTVVKDCPETVNFRNKLLLKLNLRKSIKRADRIITISEFSKRQIIKHYGADERKITVIPCAADRNKFFPAPENTVLPAEIAEKYGVPEKYYLYLGTLEPRKNIARLIDAYAAAKAKADVPKLVIAGGKGWMFDEIFSRVRELSLEEDVIFTGYVEDSHVPELMRYAMAFCFPSLYEGFGMPPLEAMACGVPVIVSDCSSLPEVVGNCGIRVDPYSVSEITEAMLKIIEPEFAAEQKQAGIKRAAEFSWQKNAELLKKLTEEPINE